MLWVALMAVAAAPMSVQDFLPCRAGTQIVYRWEDRNGRDSGLRRTDRVLSSDGRLCKIRMTTTQNQRGDVYVLERLADRVLDAGYADTMTAFRAPLLRAPIDGEQRWRFNRVDYRSKLLIDGIRVPAGRFAPVVRVRAESVPAGRYRAVRHYARHVGLIRDQRPDGAWVAWRVTSTATSSAAKGRDGPEARVVRP